MLFAVWRTRRGGRRCSWSAGIAPLIDLEAVRNNHLRIVVLAWAAVKGLISQSDTPELPANVKGEAARKAVYKLIRAGLLEEVRGGGSLPVWRRDDEIGPMALRITNTGLAAIDVER
jgi:hypothetical protein